MPDTMYDDVIGGHLVEDEVRIGRRGDAPDIRIVRLYPAERKIAKLFDRALNPRVNSLGTLRAVNAYVADDLAKLDEGPRRIADIQRPSFFQKALT